MKRESVSSSDLRSVGYENRTLEIEFHSGGVYQYFNVPSDVYSALMNADSHGIYFNRNIKNEYQWAKVR